MKDIITILFVLKLKYNVTLSGIELRQRFALTIMALIVLLSFEAFSQADTVSKYDKYFAMSIEELMDVEVSTASMKIEESKYAPGIITTITSEEIKRFGGNNLFEILDRFPNVISSVGIGLNRVGIRGGDLNKSIVKVLFLIDGRPVLCPGGNLAAYNLFEAFPIDRIKQIEVIRGPGSVLYGTNAFDGIINIITKSGEENETYASLEFGQYNRQEIEIASHYQEDDLNMSFGYKLSETDGAPLQTNNEIAPGTTYNRHLPENVQGVSSVLNYKGFSASVYVGNVERGTQATYTDYRPIGYFVPDSTQVFYTTDLKQINFGYKFSPVDDLNINTNFTYLDERFKWIMGGNEFINSHGNEFFYEANANYTAVEDLDIMCGFVYNNSIGDKSQALPLGFNKEFFSLYSQVDYWLNENIKLIGGAQFNKIDKIKGTFVPRLGAIFQFNDYFGVKALCSQAFRSPGPYESDIVNSDLQRGNPNLTSELVTTYDLQLFYSTEKLKMAVTGYLSYQKDLIVSVDTTLVIDGDSLNFHEYFINHGELQSVGIEFESKYSLFDNWFTTASFIYQTNKNGMDVENYTLSPNSILKLGISYDRPELSLSLFYSHSSAYQDVRIRNPHPNVVNPEPKAFGNLNGHLVLRLNTILPASVPDIDLIIHATNLLDEKAYFPDYLWSYWNSAPGLPGRAINFKIAAKF